VPAPARRGEKLQEEVDAGLSSYKRPRGDIEGPHHPRNDRPSGMLGNLTTIDPKQISENPPLSEAKRVFTSSEGQREKLRLGNSSSTVKL